MEIAGVFVGFGLIVFALSFIVFMVKDNNNNNREAEESSHNAQYSKTALLVEQVIDGVIRGLLKKNKDHIREELTTVDNFLQLKMDNGLTIYEVLQMKASTANKHYENNLYTYNLDEVSKDEWAAISQYFYQEVFSALDNNTEIDSLLKDVHKEVMNRRRSVDYSYSALEELREGK